MSSAENWMELIDCESDKNIFYDMEASIFEF